MNFNNLQLENPSNFNNLEELKRNSNGFKTNNELKENIKKCLFTTKILKFTLFNINSNENPKNFLNNLNNTLQTWNKSDNKSVNFIVEIIGNFRTECDFKNKYYNEDIEVGSLEFKLENKHF